MKKDFQRKHKKEPWQIAAARYCVANSEKGFTQKDLMEYIKSFYGVSDKYIEQFYSEEISWPAGRGHPRNFQQDADGGRWIPPLDLVSKVTDYDELKEARKNARQAFRLAIIAIIISAVSLVVNVIYGYRN